MKKRKNKNILFVTEGKTENRLIDLFKKYFFDEYSYTVVVYQTSLYELLDNLFSKENDGVSLTSYLITNKLIQVEENERNIDSTFSFVYLIFDYEFHHQKFDYDKLKKAIERFSDETEEGMLIINYPMLESFYHIKSLKDETEFIKSTISLNTHFSKYKKIVENETCIVNYKDRENKFNLNKQTLEQICNLHLKKYLHILKSKKYNGIQTEKLLDKQSQLMNKSYKIYILNCIALLIYEFN